MWSRALYFYDNEDRHDVPLGLARPGTVIVLFLYDDDLTLVQPSILHRVLWLAQVLICVTHVLVPQSHLLLCLYAEQLPHLLLNVLCKT